jgi:hypothetical protein
MSGGGGNRSGPSAARKAADRKRKSGTESGVGAGSSGKPKDPCDIAFETELESLQKPVLQTVTVGQRLAVGIVTSGSYEAVVCTVGKSKAVLGTLAGFPGLAALIACIKQGNNYSATITKLDRGRCRVAVKRS